MLQHVYIYLIIQGIVCLLGFRFLLSWMMITDDSGWF